MEGKNFVIKTSKHTGIKQVNSAPLKIVTKDGQKVTTVAPVWKKAAEQYENVKQQEHNRVKRTYLTAK